MHFARRIYLDVAEGAAVPFLRASRGAGAGSMSFSKRGRDRFGQGAAGDIVMPKVWNCGFKCPPGLTRDGRDAARKLSSSLASRPRDLRSP